RMERFIKQYDLTLQNAEILTRSKEMADFFEECVELYKNPREISNWLIGELIPHIRDKNVEIEELKVTPKHLTDMLRSIDDGTISRKMAKSVFQEILSTGKMPDLIIKEKGLKKILDEKYVVKMVEKVLKENPQAVKDALADEKAINYLMGQLMKLTKGKIDPKVAGEIMRRRLSDLAKRIT
ncbi:MAG: Asp-tRNA(Asn)/Glu-tRNA(Gln) amidotransferase GatCAB subunit B, partial [archaeon]|nr:Asp-tRNA(Asn)/Glu-tRNA(Gln) amidotransferase GatCAB subunit B [archaeon]